MSKNLLIASISVLALASVTDSAEATGWKLRDPDIKTVVDADNRNANHNHNTNKASANAGAKAHAGASASNKNYNNAHGGHAKASNKNANIAANHNKNYASGGHANAVGKGGNAKANVRNNNHVEGSRAYAKNGDVSSVNKLSNDSINKQYAKTGDVSSTNKLSNDSTSKSYAKSGDSYAKSGDSYAKAGDVSSTNKLSNDSASKSNANNKNNVTVSPTNNVDTGSNNTNSIDTGSNNTIDAASNNTNNFDGSTTNDVSSSAANDASNNNSTTFNGGDTNIEAIALDYDAIDLANLPVAVCQGSSVTASGSGNDGLFGIGLGFGKSNIDDQCTLRENIRAVATLAEHVPQLRHDVLQAVAHLDGFGHLWPQDQHPKCAKWLKKGSSKAQKYNCQLPNIASPFQGGAKPVAHAKPQAIAPGPKNYIVYFDFDKSKLTNAGEDIVSDAAAAILRHGAQVVVISGHTDRAGDVSYNEKLSKRRSKTVRKALVSKGVPEEIIRTGSFGERQPAVATADGVPKALNRRAEVVIQFVSHSEPNS